MSTSECRGLPHLWVSYSAATTLAYCRLCDVGAFGRSLNEDCPKRESDEQFRQRLIEAGYA